jgi:thiol-disulfide isomerase/thioredoxin
MKAFCETFMVLLFFTPGLSFCQVWDEHVPGLGRLASPAQPAPIRRPSDTGAMPPLTGQPAPEFSLRDLNGTEVSLASLRGSVVLLDFWATWCGPCRMELPVIEKLHRKYQDKGLIVLGVNDEQPETALRYLDTMKYTLATLNDSGHTVHREYHVNAIPTMVLIDRDGVVSGRFVGTRSDGELEAAVRQVMRRTVTAASYCPVTEPAAGWLPGFPVKRPFDKAPWPCRG